MPAGKIKPPASARLLLHNKRELDGGGIIEIRIWQVPAAVAGSAHFLKYSLYYGKDGRRLVGYDNERGKGDHRHCGDHEEPFAFVDAETLVANFLADVRRLRGSG